jgi:hypothetical protein
MASMLMANREVRPNEGKGLQRMFALHHLTLGVFFPIEAFQGDQPAMREQRKLGRRAEESGFARLLFRDVPLRNSDFGDIGQVHGPEIFPGWIAAQTQSIALAAGSLILPLRHPLHTAKAAASVTHDRGESHHSQLQVRRLQRIKALDEIGKAILPLLETGSQNAIP